MHEKFFTKFITLCQSLSCDIPCVDRLSLSSKWPQTKSYSRSLPQVRFDINALSPNIQISRSCSDRQSLNPSRERGYCYNSQFKFPSWIDKPLFGAKPIVLRSPSIAILATLDKEHCFWIWSAFLDTLKRVISYRLLATILKIILLQDGRASFSKNFYEVTRTDSIFFKGNPSDWIQDLDVD